MEEETQKLTAIHKKVRQRFRYSAITLLLYASFVICYTDAGRALSRPLGNSQINGALLLFTGLILLFLALEYLFLKRDKNPANPRRPL